MKKFLFLFLTAIPWLAQSQTSGEDISVQVSATAQPGSITMSWYNDGTATGYDVYRRMDQNMVWGSPVATLAGSATNYTDNTVIDGEAHEYKIVKNGTTTAYGYIYAGHEKAAIINRGILIIVVEDTYQGNTTFDTAIQNTIDDIENDGWIVERLDVNQGDAVATVKSQITSIYNQNPTDTRAIYLIGHVPVPYSGELNPDGHADHVGAWPADMYYGELDGSWTDNGVNNSSAAQVRNHNIPGDGKFDQSILNSAIELQVGRVDFANLSAFAASEEELLVRYLNKAHAYKNKVFEAEERALIDDNFTTFGEGFSASGYRNFAPMFTASNVDKTLDLRTATSNNSYMWSYGCGAGTYTSCQGIGSTNDLSGDSLQTIFSMLFGSYFGDWDSDNNFLRSMIAQGQTMNAMWAGRPQWNVHHMALGHHIGFSSLLTQNNQSNTGYFGSTTGYFDNWVHIALMGDPTMRMHYLLPPTNLIVSNNNEVADLTWTASPDANLGYNVYRLLPGSSSYEKLNAQPVLGTSYSDNTIVSGGEIVYVVKAVDLKLTASGSYLNESLGVRDQAAFTASLEELSTAIHLYPNPTTDQLTVKGEQIISYAIYAMNGTLLHQELSSATTININNHVNDMYIIELTTINGEKIRRRFIKQ